MNARGLLLLCTTLLLLAGPVRAADTLSDEGERQRIAVERQQADADFSRREQACRTRFAVAACLEEARKQHRDVNARLRLQLSMLDESQRKRRAAERIDTIRAKVSAEEAMRREVDLHHRDRLQARPAAAAAASGAASAAATPKPVRLPTPSPKVRAETPAADLRAATEARKRSAESRSRREAAQAHREAVERRNALRAASGKVAAAPLPLPPAASAARP